MSKDTPSGHSISPSGQDAKEFLATSAENENLDAETSKRVERVVQEGESAVQGKLNTLYRYLKRDPSSNVLWLVSDKLRINQM